MVAARESFDDLEGRVNFISGAGYEPVSGDTGLQPVQTAVESANDAVSQDQSDQHGLQTRVTSEPLVYDWNQHPQKIRLAIDLVRFEPQDRAIAEHLLGTTVIVDTLDDAVELLAHRPDRLPLRHAGRRGRSKPTARSAPAR